MAKRSDIDWAGVRAAFVTRAEAVSDIASRFGCSTSGIYRRAQLENWLGNVSVLVAADADRCALLRRLYRTIDRKLAQLEVRMETNDDLSIADHERETRAIGQLIRNVEKIVELEEAAETAARQRRLVDDDEERPQGGADADEIRRELAERIFRFRELKRGNG